MPDYSLLKILHMTAALLTVGGILLSALTIVVPPPAARLAAVRRWDLFVTTPALTLLWILGIILAVEGHWFSSGWLSLKLVFVLALSALHGMLAAGMRKMQRGQPVRAFLRFSPYIAIVCVFAIIALVAFKPF